MTRRAAGEDAAPAIILGDWRPSTNAELDEAARITEADLEHAMQKARTSSPEMRRFLEATSDDTQPARRRPGQRRPVRRKPAD